MINVTCGINFLYISFREYVVTCKKSDTSIKLKKDGNKFILPRILIMGS